MSENVSKNNRLVNARIYDLEKPSKRKYDWTNPWPFIFLYIILVCGGLGYYIFMTLAKVFGWLR